MRHLPLSMLLLPLFFAHFALPYRILVALSPDSKSMFRSIVPLANRLARGGHQVHIFHVASSDSTAEVRLASNVSLIWTPILTKRDVTMKEAAQRVWTRTKHAAMEAQHFELLSRPFLEVLDNSADKLVSVLNAHWDLVVCGDAYAIYGYAFAQALRAHAGTPFAMFSGSWLGAERTRAIAMGHNWVTHPHPNCPIPGHPDDAFEPCAFDARVANVLEHLGGMGAALFIDHFVIAPRLALLTGRRHFSFAELYAQSEMTLVDSIELLAFPQPSVREVLNSGAHCEESAPLPEDYRAFVEDPSSKGTVYVAFGTFIPWDYAPPHVAEAFFNAFERLPDYRFVFSYRGKFPNRTLSAHIRLVSWAPQLDLLAHPKTRVFLTHCGLKSIKESLCTRTPMFAMPMFAEQAHNAKMVLKFGTGIALSKFSVDEEKVYAGIRELLDNPTYARRVHTLQRIFVDRPMDALDEAEFYLSRVARGGPARLGRNFHKRKGVDLWLLQSAHLDAVLALFAIALLLSK